MKCINIRGMKRLLEKLLYRTKWHLAPYVNHASPVHVDLELSSVCNLKCVICHRHDKNWQDGFMGLDVFKKFIDEAVSMGVKSIKLNFRGESLLNPDFTNMVEYVEGKFVEVMINTNLQSDNMSKILNMALYVDNISISVDSIKDEYEKVRRGASWHKLVCNLEMLYLYKNSLTIQRRTIKDMEVGDKEFRKFFDMFPNVKIKSKPAFQRNDNDIFLKRGKGRKFCGQPSRRLVVTWDGKVYGCCVSYKEPAELYLGNSLKRAWDNPKRLKLISRLKRNCLDGTCKDCTSRESYR